MDKQQLTPEQESYINKATFGGVLGYLYALSSGLYKEFWLSFIPFYNIYIWIKLIIKGRKMAWEAAPNSLSFEDFQYHQKKLSKIAIILTCVIAAFYILFFGIMIISAVLFSGFSGGFGEDTAKSFAANLYKNEPIEQYISPSYQPNTPYINYQKDTRGEFSDVSFNSYNRSNNVSNLQGYVYFENGKLPICISLVNISDQWKVTSVAESCN